jgi:hypothetical protein
MKPGVLNLAVNPGTRFQRTFTWKNVDGTPADLTGYWAVLQVRYRPDSADPLLEATSDVAGGITLGGAAGTIAVSSDLPVTFAPGTYAWDLRLVSGLGAGLVLLAGRFEVGPLISRKVQP